MEKEVVFYAVEWSKARAKVCSMMASDKDYMKYLNALSEMEDKLSKSAKAMILHEQS